MRFHKNLPFFLCLFFILIGVGGCTTSLTYEKTSTPPLINPASTLFPTITPSFTSTRKSGVQNTPIPPVPIFIAVATTRGDGGEPGSGYLTAPSLVIFGDGKAIFLEGEYPKYRFKEAKLSTDEMCSILEKVGQTGIFNLNLSSIEFLPREDSPIYQFDKKPLTSMGAGGYYFVVNGSPSEEPFIKINVYGPYEKYLVEEVRQAAEILKGFQPHQKTNYLPESLLLWIGKVNGPLSDNVIPHTWAAQLPSLSVLINGQDENQVLIENELVIPIEKMFDYQQYLRQLGGKNWLKSGMNHAQTGNLLENFGQ